MNNRHQVSLFGVLALGFIFLFSCEKDSYYTNSSAMLRFSTDTVAFDTVFTTIGSATANFRVYNAYSEHLEINSIRLEGGSASNFRINVDGKSGLEVTEKLLRAQDSMYVFVDVNVDPSDKNLPFRIHDYIIFNTNGREQKILLEAYGQDAYHIRLGEWGDIGYQINAETKDTTFISVLNNDTALKADKPYYLHNSLAINEDVELILEAGVRFFIEKNMSVYVLGSLKSKGTVDAPIVFRGHRLDKMVTGTPYDKYSGQWGTLAFQRSSYNNELTHTNIRNGLIGLYVDSLSTNNKPKVKLANCRIENMTSAAIHAINGEITADNCLFANCDQFIFGASAGGKYKFTNCTFGNYYKWANRTEPSVVLTNYYLIEDYPYDLQQADFINCIIDGTTSDELSLSNATDAEFNYSFDHCLIKADTSKIDTTDTRFTEVIWNKDPLFLDPKEEWNFYPDTLSPVINMGKVTHLNADINKTPYTDAPDIGAFEFSEAKVEE